MQTVSIASIENVNNAIRMRNLHLQTILFQGRGKMREQGRLKCSDGLLHCVLEIFMLRKNASSCFEADKTKGLIAKASGRLKAINN